MPCPECAQLMNRVNFAHCSSVIVDVCKEHGTWFDSDELRRIVEFIHAGGLTAARAQEKQKIIEIQRELRQQHLGTPAADHFTNRPRDEQERAGILAAARELLKVLRD
ncbi:MAG: zf-TFIIB domain-containing protein [Pyrinomonadaceae bacterium]